MEIFKKEKHAVEADDILRALAKGQEVSLSRCTIKGSLDLNRFFDTGNPIDRGELIVQEFGENFVVTFTQKISFNNCRFEDNVIFASPWAKPDALKVVFKNDISFNSSSFRGQSRFSGAQMYGVAGFDGCTFDGVASFRDVRFHSSAMFRTAQFNGYVLFNNAEFIKQAYFSGTFFAKGVNCTSAVFKDRTDFSGVYAGSKTVPVYEDIVFAKWRNGDDESFWRFIKQCAQESGHYQLAGESFYKERCAHLWLKLCGSDYDSLGFFGKCWRQIWGLRLLPELVFGRMLFGYGERPIRVLASSAMLIMLCALIYWVNPSQILFQDAAATNEGFVDYLYFSITTFATLGLGDVYPVKDSFIRIVVMLEVLGGACLMSLFIVSLAKRFSRS